MSDPHAVFRNGTEANRLTVQAVWPDLYNALAGVRTADDQLRDVGCVIGPCGKPAEGRLTLNGHPACAEHIARHATRAGGWPLALTDPRKVGRDDRS